jgi:hypothetical protein
MANPKGPLNPEIRSMTVLTGGLDDLELVDDSSARSDVREEIDSADPIPRQRRKLHLLRGISLTNRNLVVLSNLHEAKLVRILIV